MSAARPRPFTDAELAERRSPLDLAETAAYLDALPQRMRDMGFPDDRTALVVSQVAEAAAYARLDGQPLSYAALEQGARLLANRP